MNETIPEYHIAVYPETNKLTVKLAGRIMTPEEVIPPESVDAQPVKAEPVDPTKAEQMVQAEPVKLNPVKADAALLKAEAALVNAEPVDAQQGSSKEIKADTVNAKPANGKEIDSEAAQAEEVRADATTTKLVKPEHTKQKQKPAKAKLPKAKSVKENSASSESFEKEPPGNAYFVKLQPKKSVLAKEKASEIPLKSLKEEAVNTEGIKAKDPVLPNNEDKNAFEDYMKNELPKFSGDVSSAIQKNLGDPTGYDVHIEVKISNRSKTKFDKGGKERGQANVVLNDVVNDPDVSHKNRMKAKKILDLIIDKLKHKKGGKEKFNDTTDVEIEDVVDSIGAKKKKKSAKEASSKSDGEEAPIDDQAGKEQESKTGNVDKLDELNKQVDLKGKTSKEEHNKSGIKANKDRSINKIKDKSTDDESSHKKSADDSKSKLAFNLPQKASKNLKEEPSTQDVPNIVNTDNNASLKTAKSVDNKEKEKTETRYIKVKSSGDEIRIKVPEFMNKTVLFSQIINLIEEDGKKGQISKLLKAKTGGGLEESKHSILQVGSKFLLLKKISSSNETSKVDEPTEEKDKSTAAEDPNKHLPEVVVPSDDAHKMYKLHTENKNGKVKEMKESFANETTNDNEELEDASVKENNRERNFANETNGNEESEEPSIKKKDDEKENKKKDKSFENDSDSLSNDDRYKSENFIPNNFASKSFQENLEPDLEPGEIGKTINEGEKKNMTNDAEPELQIEDLDQVKSNKKTFSKTNKEHSNDKNMAGIFKHTTGKSFNPSRLFNDSLFRETALEGTDGVEGGGSTDNDKAPTDGHFGSGKKSKKAHQSIADVLTAKESNPHNNRKPTTLEDTNEKINTKDDTETGEKGRRSHKHRKIYPEGEHNKQDEGRYLKEQREHEERETTANNINDGGSPEEMGTAEQYKPLNNPLPNILFKEILNTDESGNSPEVGEGKSSAKKSDADKDAIEDEEKGEGEEKGEETENISNIKNKIASLLSKRQGGKKVDLSKLASLEVKSKQDVDIGTDDGESGDDDDYEEASADDADDVKENPDINGLGEANLAIWKASEDIHALLHSLQDKDHADKAMENLKTFIKNKNIEDAKKRDVTINKKPTQVGAAKKRDLTDNERRKAKNHHHSKIKSHRDNRLPSFEFEFRKKSLVPRHTDEKKSQVSRNVHEKKLTKKILNKRSPSMSHQITSKKRQKIRQTTANKRQRILFDKFTNHTGQGIDRLYNQLATANSRVPPTFDDDGDGWSSDDVSNVIKQLKTTDMDDDLPSPGAEPGINPGEYPGVSMYTGKRLHQVGLPQGIDHAAISAPMKELINYQNEVRTQMALSATKDHIMSKSPRQRQTNMFSKSARIPNMFPKSASTQNILESPNILQYRKNKVLDAHIEEPAPGLPFEDEFDGSKENDVVQDSRQRSHLPVPYNSTVGDHFKTTDDYKLNKNELWWSHNFKRNSIHQNVTT